MLVLLYGITCELRVNILDCVWELIVARLCISVKMATLTLCPSFLSLLRVCVLLLFLGVSMDMSMDVLRGE
jgi:hypothetical protein